MGDPSTEILAQAETLDAQLVVLATQGASGVSKFVFGSVAERVLRKTTRPVLVVPPPSTAARCGRSASMEEVLAPIDFHDLAFEDATHRRPRGARQPRAPAAAARGRRWRRQPLDGPPARRWPTQLEEQLGGLRTSAMDAAQQALERLAESVGGTPGPTLEVAQGPIAEQIAQVADRAEVDLIVLGLRGVPGLLGARVGAVAYRVLCASPVPVLAVPHEARGEHTLAFLGCGPQRRRMKRAMARPSAGVSSPVCARVASPRRPND